MKINNGRTEGECTESSRHWLLYSHGRPQAYICMILAEMFIAAPVFSVNLITSRRLEI
jgi:hypothetical protein